MNNVFSGFADEAGSDLATQVRATRELGWRNIEMRNVTVPGFPSGNLHDIPDEAFHVVAGELERAGINIHCWGSAIANGSKSIEKPFEIDLEQTKRAAARMPKIGSRFIRIMSYPILPETVDQQEVERFRRLREIQKIMDDAGVTVLHENCSNYGGMGWSYSLRLLEEVPGLKLVFDTGNCVFDRDFTRLDPAACQSTWEFYSHVRPYIVHLHIKDGVHGPQGEHIHVFPGEGTGDVRRVMIDLLATGYTGAFSIEPHLKIDAATCPAGLSLEEHRYQSYVAYGKRAMELVP
ncbi:MAG: sugar phosphate isomerase/epimerase [Methylacidiphilales bacterium]|nr:sugar phosphate isomerase/epimerase [Candidatus Methylacidiphilales bacterium]